MTSFNKNTGFIPGDVDKSDHLTLVNHIGSIEVLERSGFWWISVTLIEKYLRFLIDTVRAL